MTNIAIIRLKGQPGKSKEVKDTLDMLRLYRKNYLTIIKDTPQAMGMLRKVKDFVTWGKVSDEIKLPKAGFIKLPYTKKAKTGNMKEKISELIVKHINITK